MKLCQKIDWKSKKKNERRSQKEKDGTALYTRFNINGSTQIQLACVRVCRKNGVFSSLIFTSNHKIGTTRRRCQNGERCARALTTHRQPFHAYHFTFCQVAWIIYYSEPGKGGWIYSTLTNAKYEKKKCVCVYQNLIRCEVRAVRIVAMTIENRQKKNVAKNNHTCDNVTYHSWWRRWKGSHVHTHTHAYAPHRFHSRHMHKTSNWRTNKNK